MDFKDFTPLFQKAMQSALPNNTHWNSYPYIDTIYKISIKSSIIRSLRPNKCLILFNSKTVLSRRYETDSWFRVTQQI